MQFARLCRAAAFLLLAALTLFLSGCSSSGPGGTTTSGTNPVPTLASISPNSILMGSSGATLTATGTNFISTSTVNWNGTALTTTYTNSTTLTAQVPSGDLTTVGTASVTITNPAPGGGTSSAATFTINGTTTQVVSVVANDLAWDPVNQVIYLSLPSTDARNGNSVQILNPATATLGTAVAAGSNPNLLAVSATSQFLYVSQNGASTVQVLTLPSLGSDYTIQLGNNSQYGPYYAMDLQAAPNADGTVAVVLGTPGYSPEETGGVNIYVSGTARADALCGFGASACPNSSSNELFDSIQWNSGATEMFAQDYETTSYDFYTMPVSTSGFGTVTDYPALAPGAGDHIHYDATTGYVYSDCGCVIDPNNGTIVGSFGVTGLMQPDGAIGAAFFLGQTQSQVGTQDYTIESFNISTFVSTNSMVISNVVGTPTAFILWGSSGLAFISVDNTQSPPTGAVYIINGQFVSDEAARVQNTPSENVQRTWKPRDAFHKLMPVNDKPATK